MACVHPLSCAYLFFVCLVATTGFSARDQPWRRHFSRGIVTPTNASAAAYRTRWAILVAGSAGYGNYRHQADVCHAYHVLRRGGLKEENIVVFMFDDIANHPANPHPGTIINSPTGEDVYAGVPKDYIGYDVTVTNVLAAFLGDESSVTGGSGKVINSGPEDHIFMFYSDHGGPGVLGMPTNPNLFANDLVAAFKKKHELRGYKEMVVYLEACESGSIFEGILPNDLDIYAMTASNAEESSWGTYCPGMVPPPPPEYLTCLGDLYSVSWMEDSETHNMKNESLEEQYEAVKSRTSNYNMYTSGSHVMRYGSLQMSTEKLYAYIGNDPANENFNRRGEYILMPSESQNMNIDGSSLTGIMQRDADILYLWHKFKAAQEGSNSKVIAQDALFEALAYRRHIDRSIWRVGETLFGKDLAQSVLDTRRMRGQPVVDDWDCLKAMVEAFEEHCSALTSYGLKHMRAFANICNTGVGVNEMKNVMSQVCKENAHFHSF